MIEKGNLLLFNKMTYGERQIMKVDLIQKTTHAMTKQTDFWVIAHSIDGRISHKSTMSGIEYMITAGEISVLDQKYLPIIELLFK